MNTADDAMRQSVPDALRGSRADALLVRITKRVSRRDAVSVIAAVDVPQNELEAAISFFTEHWEL